jgi:hypothetical protein
MIKSKILGVFIVIMLLVNLCSFFASAEFFSNKASTSSFSIQYSNPFGSSYSSLMNGIGNRGGSIDRGGYYDVQFFIPPLGCEPTVVRSDLLEEQDVPVFCKLVPLKINPGVNINRISSISVSQKSDSPYISGTGFHPANALIQAKSTLVNTPSMDNIGYVVVVLKKQENEKAMPDSVNVTLSASMKYSAENTFGIGESEFYLPVLTKEEFENQKSDYGFYDGIGYLRVEEIDESSAVLSIYDSRDKRIFNQRLEKGATSKEFYLDTLYGGQGIKLTLKDITLPETQATIKVNGNTYNVYKGESFYSSKCRLLEVNSFTAGSGTAKVSCSGKTFNLQKKLNKIKLEIDGNVQSFAVGENLNIVNDGNYAYLVYSNYRKISDSAGKETKDVSFFFIAEIPKSKIDSLEDPKKQDFISGIQKKIERKVKSAKTFEEIKVVSISLSEIDSSSKSNSNILHFISNENQESKEIKIGSTSKASVKLSEVLFTNDYLSPDASKYFNYASNSYENVNSLFSGEPYPGSVDSYSYGELALWQEYSLAHFLGQKDNEMKILSAIMNNYPNSKSPDSKITASQLISSAKVLSSEGSSDYYSKEDISIELLGVKQPSLEENNVLLHTSYEPVSAKYVRGSSVFSSPKNTEEPTYQVILDHFTDDTVYFNCTYKVLDRNGNPTGNYKYERASATLTTPVQIKNCKNIKITLDQINRKKVAKVQLTPITTGRVRESNFSFSIGIEKRAIQLTPEEASKKITDLNKQIGDWENITDTLGKFIEAEKAACLATTAIINIRNLFDARSGIATARTAVMSRWNNLCQDKTIQTEYKVSNVDDCIAAVYNDKIKPEINAAKDYMSSYNSLEAAARQQANSYKGDAKDIVAKGNIMGKINAVYAGNLTDVTGKNALKVSDFVNPNNVNFTGYSDLSNLYLNLQMMQNPKLDEKAREVYKNKAYDELSKINEMKKTYTPSSVSQAYNGFPVSTPLSGSGSSQVMRYEGKQWKDAENTFKLPTDTSVVIDTNAAVAIVAGNLYVLPSAPTKSSPLQADKVYGIKSSDNRLYVLSDSEANKLKDKYSFQAYDSSLTKNTCKNCNYAKVFALDPYKGMPELLPFDCQNGWYVQTEQLVSGGFGLGGTSSQSYFSSGAVNNFWLCNVGPNGLMEGKGIGDDSNCINFQLSTGQSPTTVPGLNTEAAKTKIDEAISAVKDAQKQMASEPSRLSINSRSCDSLSVRGSSGNAGGKCTDFMSPDECQLIFNVCDPVVCPNSRCDLGGKFKVDNVIQSGIVGSTVLCLPNFIGFQGKKDTGVVIPVCLTGINAGIEGWVSILKSYRDCLNESITNNKTVGICDAIQSIYVCDFFWRQAAPFTEALMKNLFLSLFQSNIEKGGAEYAFTTDAWNNVQNSMAWMQTMYGKDSKLIFSLKDITNSIVAEVCKSSASVTYPTIEQSLEPESPVQYHASFEENSYTTGTVPPTSSYKVFYTIYAGKDSGHYYQVYLKESPSGIGYAGRETSYIASGYVSAGQTATETKDFIDASGYKQLCIRIDNVDKCGFKSLSTSFAVNYAKDLAIKDQLSNPVTTERACVSGTQSAGAFLTPNIQQGVTEFLNPELYNQGVTRVCSGKNPGLGVDINRWKDVGYCGDSNIRCWVDEYSVKKAIQGKGIENETLSGISSINLNNLMSQGNYLGEGEAENAIKDLTNVYLEGTASIFKQFQNDKDSSFDSITFKGNENMKDINNKSFNGRTLKDLDADIEMVSDRLIIGRQKADLLLLKSKIYDAIARELKKRIPGLALGSVGVVGASTVKPVEILFDYNSDEQWIRAFYSDDSYEVVLKIEDNKLYWKFKEFYFKVDSNPELLDRNYLVGTLSKDLIVISDKKFSDIGSSYLIDKRKTLLLSLNGKRLSELTQTDLSLVSLSSENSLDSGNSVDTTQKNINPNQLTKIPAYTATLVNNKGFIQKEGQDTPFYVIKSEYTTPISNIYYRANWLDYTLRTNFFSSGVYSVFGGDIDSARIFKFDDVYRVVEPFHANKNLKEFISDTSDLNEANALNGRLVQEKDKQLIFISSEAVELAKMIYGEERNQGEEAMNAAGWVAINRLQDGRFGNDLKSVLSASKQFYGYNAGLNYRILTGSDKSAWDDALNIAQEIIENMHATPEEYADFLYFGNGEGVKNQMTTCVKYYKNKEDFEYYTVPETNMYLSNLDYGACSSGSVIFTS